MATDKAKREKEGERAKDQRDDDERDADEGEDEDGSDDASDESDEDESDEDESDDADEASEDADEGEDEDSSDDESDEDESDDADESEDQVVAGAAAGAVAAGGAAAALRARRERAAAVERSTTAATLRDRARQAVAEEEREQDQARAARVATALGVGEEGVGVGEKAEGEDEGDEKEEPVKNRAQRRREDALRRREQKTGAKAGPSGDDDLLPRDRNARAKELLARRREEAKATQQKPGLAASEIVQDQFVRATSGAGKWLKEHLNVIQWVVLGGVVATAGVLIYRWYANKEAGIASSTLFEGVIADSHPPATDEDWIRNRGFASANELREKAGAKNFASETERHDIALAAYGKAAAEHPGTGVAHLARLGQAGALYEKGDYEGAKTAFDDVLASKLAAADEDVRGRALEGLGFVLEAKKDLDGALGKYTDLAGVKGFEDLGQYHQGRIHAAKGDTEKSKEVLSKLRAEIEPIGLENPYLLDMVVDALRKVDPSTPPPKGQLDGPLGPSMQDPEALRRQIEELQRKMQEQQPPGGDVH